MLVRKGGEGFEVGNSKIKFPVRDSRGNSRISSQLCFSHSWIVMPVQRDPRSTAWWAKYALPQPQSSVRTGRSWVPRRNIFTTFDLSRLIQLVPGYMAYLIMSRAGGKR